MPVQRPRRRHRTHGQRHDHPRERRLVQFCQRRGLCVSGHIYEWLPGLHQIISSFRDKSWQYVFRFALDGLVKMRQSYNNEFFFQGAIISNSIDEFSSKKLKERVQIK